MSEKQSETHCNFSDTWKQVALSKRFLASVGYFSIFAMIPLFSWLMLTNYPMFNLKFSSSSWKGNEIRYLFVLISFAMLFVLKLAVFSFIVAFYLLLSLIFFSEQKKK